MKVAIKSGDALKVAHLMRQSPGLDVNMDVDDDGRGWTLLHHACLEDSGSSVIPILMAHPDINVNVKTPFGTTPFLIACWGRLSCVREMLKDSRVKVNEPDNYGETAIWRVAHNNSLDVLKWWIASGIEIDLGVTGDFNKSDASGMAMKYNETEAETLLYSFKKNPENIRHATRVELGWYNEAAAQMFAMVIFASDGLLEIRQGEGEISPAARFFSIAKKLPEELQMVLCCRMIRSMKDIIPRDKMEGAFKELARNLCLISFFESVKNKQREK